MGMGQMMGLSKIRRVKQLGLTLTTMNELSVL